MNGSEIRNDELVAAMESAARDGTPESRRGVYAALRAANVLMPILAQPEGVPDGESAPAERDVTISVITLQGQDGRTAIPLFTDIDALRAWKPEGTPYVALAAPDVFAMIASAPPDALVINPAGPTGGEISQQEFLALHEGRTPGAPSRHELPAGTQLLIGAPSDELAGPQVEEALREALAVHPEVFAGYLLAIASGPEPVRLTVGLQLREALDETALYALFDDIGRQLQPVLDGRPLDFVPLEGSLLETARTIGPVYLA